MLLLDVATAYFDLVQANAHLEINRDILAKAEQILKAAKSGEKQGLTRTAADVNRAETEVSQRRVERQDLDARVTIASARLVRLLALDPLIMLAPADESAVTIELIPSNLPLEQLLDQALRNRPELAAAAANIEAAEARARQARYSPLIPKLQAEYLGGGFGGGVNGKLTNPDGRSDVAGQMFWELKGLGFGNLADVRLRNSERDRALLVAVAARAQVGAEVVTAAKLASASRASLDDVRKATQEAREMFRKLSATSFGMIGPRGQFDALEPLLAVQALNQSRVQALVATMEYNRAQLRSLTAIGQQAAAPIAPPELPNPAEKKDAGKP